jgi:cytochrome c-type biogenesis protein
VHPTLWLALLAGLVSFFSPCSLPLYPSYLSYISGVAVQNDVASPRARLRVALHSICFVLGVSVVFFALGLSASALGQAFAAWRSVIRIFGGALVLVMGLFLAGLVPSGTLHRERRWLYRAGHTGYIASVLVGVSFAAGWTPCIGPILASVLVLAATHAATGVLLIAAYTAGFAIPFLLLALTLTSIRGIVRYAAPLQRAAGVVLVVMGALLMTGELDRLSAWLTRWWGSGLSL